MLLLQSYQSGHRGRFKVKIQLCALTLRIWVNVLSIKLLELVVQFMTFSIQPSRKTSVSSCFILMQLLKTYQVHHVVTCKESLHVGMVGPLDTGDYRSVTLFLPALTRQRARGATCISIGIVQWYISCHDVQGVIGNPQQGDPFLPLQVLRWFLWSYLILPFGPVL